MIIEAKPVRKLFDIVSTDLTQHCNARCTFCFNDWSMYKPCCMTRETYLKALQLLPHANRDGYYFSCLFEPTIHPQMCEFLGMLPRQYRDRVFFTTNLVRPLSDDELEAICSSAVDYVNVSLETYDDDLYHQLSGTKKSAFYDNLQRFGAIAQRKGFRIRLITMLLRSNAGEMVELVRRAHETVHPIWHEIRTPYVIDSKRELMDYVEGELLDREEIDAVVAGVKALGYDNIGFDTTTDRAVYQRKLAEMQAGEKEPAPLGFEYTVRVNADGVGNIVGDGNLRWFDLAKIESPFLYFGNALIELQTDEAKRFALGAVGAQAKVGERPSVRDLFLFDERFLHVILSDADGGSDGVATLKAGGEIRGHRVQRVDAERVETIIDLAALDMPRQGSAKLAYRGHELGLVDLVSGSVELPEAAEEEKTPVGLFARMARKIRK